MLLVSLLDSLIENPQTDLFTRKGLAKFLYDDVDGSKETHLLSKAFKAVLKEGGLKSDRFAYIGEGASGIVLGDGVNVLKVKAQQRNFLTSGTSIPYDKIPEGLTATLLSHGRCNGIDYEISEQVDTSIKPSPGEIIHFLFKARDKGVVYWDGGPDNFYKDREGQVKVLDHEHFDYLKNTSHGHSFEESLTVPLSSNRPASEKVCFSDGEHTYIFMLAPDQKKANAVVAERFHQKLAQLGIDEKKIEIFPSVTGARIHQTEIQFDPSRPAQPLADVLKAHFAQGHAAPGTRPANSSPGR